MMKTVNYMLIGEFNSGKTSMIQTFINGYTVHCHANTIGIDIDCKTVEIKGETIKLRIKDTAGHCRFRSMISTFYNSVTIVFVVFDISSKISFTNTLFWIEETKKIENAQIYLVGNKSDRTRTVAFVDALLLAQTHNLNYVETSILNYTSVENLFLHPFQSKIDKLEAQKSTRRDLSITQSHCCLMS